MRPKSREEVAAWEAPRNQSASGASSTTITTIPSIPLSRSNPVHRLLMIRRYMEISEFVDFAMLPLSLCLLPRVVHQFCTC
jgi:hypothetical protein